MKTLDDVITQDVIKFVNLYSAIEHCCKLHSMEKYDMDYDCIGVDNYPLNYAVSDIRANDLLFYCRFYDHTGEEIVVQYEIDSSIFLIEENPDLLYDKLNFIHEESFAEHYYKVMLKDESEKYFDEV